jgi:hypothetical protein|nr:MAG TPA: hypothetical protein [Caudoviricetes sp.]
MAKTIQLRWSQRISPIDGSPYYESNLIQVNGPAGIHIEMDGLGNRVTVFRSITGTKFVSCFQDYFGEVFDKDLLHIDIGQKYIGYISAFGTVVKFHVNKEPSYGCVVGDVEDLGDTDPDNPDIPQNVFCGKEGEPFRDINSEYLCGRQRSLNLT